jgi:CTP:molybdopterin cytidylyltransferase MocA
MAGLGQRFVDEGYSLTKPLIPVSSRPMVFQAVNSLPNPINQVFVMRKDMPGYNETKELIFKEFPDAIISTVPNVTEGQASSALIGLEAHEKNSSDACSPITFGACDFASVYNEKKLQNLISSGKADVIVWAIRGYPNALRNPNAFGWIDASEDIIKNVSVKKPLKSTLLDPIILGTFTFLKSSYFKDSLQQLINNEGRVNNEFFIDSCINEAIKLGLKCHIFEVDSYLCWGTPNDLDTFRYWQSCFDKWAGHPYELENDSFIDQGKLTSLKEEYSSKRFLINNSI